MLRLLGLVPILFFCSACSPPECIQCKGISGLPDGKICKEVYETTTLASQQTWAEFVDEALRSGCSIP
jgi:surfactin synthase thioesterase subunit